MAGRDDGKNSWKEELNNGLTEFDKKVAGWVVKGVIGLAALITLNSTLYTVDQTQQAVVTQFGKPVKVILNPITQDDTLEALKESYGKEGIEVSTGAGLRSKVPFIQTVKKFDRRLLRWNGYPEQIPTEDKVYIWVDTTARWYIKDPLKFLRSVSTEAQAHARLDDVLDSATRNSISQRELIEIVRTDNREMRVAEEELRETIKVGKVSEGRPKVMAEITEASSNICKEYGIKMPVDGVLFKGINYAEQVKVKVEGRMTAERQRIAGKYNSEGEGEYRRIMGDKEKEVKTILSDAYKNAREIEGAADAEATKIYAEAFNKDPDFYRFWRTLQLYETQLTEGETNIILGTDNPLLEYFKGDIKSKPAK